MSYFNWNPRDCSRALAAVLVASVACATLPNLSHAQQVNRKIPVLIAADDHDKGSINHCNSVHEKVLGEMNDTMLREGYRMLDEAMIRATLRWKSSCQGSADDADRRGKQLLSEEIIRMISAAKAEVPVRTWVRYTIRAQKVRYGRGFDAQVQLLGDIRDSASNQILGHFTTKRMSFPLPDDCGKTCTYEIVGDHAAEIGANLANVLARKLDIHLVAGPGGNSGNSAGSTANGSAGGGLCGNLSTPYNVSFKHFDKIEAITIAGTMMDEFPCRESMQLKSSSNVKWNYAYYSRARSHKLQEWLLVLLRDLGFSDRDIMIEVQANDIDVTKLVPTRDRPRSDDENSRFK